MSTNSTTVTMSRSTGKSLHVPAVFQEALDAERARRRIEQACYQVLHKNDPAVPKNALTLGGEPFLTFL